MNRRRIALAALLFAVAPITALAQPKPPATTPAGTPVPGLGASASSAILNLAAPAPIDVDDPMLAPMPPAGKTVTGWREALKLVRDRSTDLVTALAAVDRAEAQARIALAGALPTLSGGANVTDQLLRTTANPLTGETDNKWFPGHAVTYGANLNLVVPIFAPRAWYGIGTADVNKRAAQLSLADEKRQLAAAVASTLVSVVTAERVADLNRSGLRNALEHLELAKRRAALGAATALDIVRAEQDAATARAAVVSGDESLRQAREALGLALGFAEPYGTPADVDLQSIEKESEQACPRKATVAERPDVASLEQKTIASRRAVRDVELAFVPTVNLTSGLGVSVSNLTSAQNGTTNITSYTWTVAGVLSWNIFDGGVRYGQLRDTRAAVVQADAAYEGAKRSATIQVAQAERAVEVADASLAVARDTRRLAAETDRLARVNFALGKGTSLDLVDASRQLREAEIQLALKEFSTIQTRIQALLALSVCEY